ncbi:acyltransferase family protein [Alterisphingorhabdus coralli]|uniref:Acyltransferase family protein n=1 Tax=Alterisphingorhabdus coralli TaxID=3071408 RepID=A0AA97F8L8_9SPHN|nr:acyltransferase family protein [Parasphingorhabdus sp. SCSIO 66989]WOE75292.1 acyltransferase family protein [Parasphingorhabdus sp. SCSIO 66989]
MTAIAYRPEIDGLRALAVLPVMLFHAGFAAFSGGYVGVDIFFVISGYLITSIIINEAEQGQFSLLRFYERRARRILPALLLVIVATLPPSYFWMLGSQWDNYSESLVAVALFASNILFWLQDGYFAGLSEEKPLLHTWSLAVEEQYYILFPLLLLLVLRFRRDWLLPLIIVIAGASLGWAEYAARVWPTANFYLLPSRIWELAAGVICALWLRQGGREKIAQKSRTVINAAAIAGLGLIAASIFLFTAATPIPSLLALMPVGGTALIIVFATRQSWVGKGLSFRPLVAIGLISYGAYLWHQPILAYYRIKSFHHDTVTLCLLLLLSLVLAWISYYLVERPMRHTLLKGRSPLPFLGLSLAALALLIAIGLWGRYMPPQLPHESRYGVATSAGNGNDWRMHYAASENEDREAGIILYGDSQAQQYAAALLTRARDRQASFDYLGAPSCIGFGDLFSLVRGTIARQCRDNHRAMRTALEKHPDRVLVIAQDWTAPLADSKGTRLGSSGAGKDAMAASELRKRFTDFIEDLPESRKVIIIGQVPTARAALETMEHGPARCQQYVDAECPDHYPRRHGLMRDFNSAMAKLAAKHSNIIFIDPYAVLCDSTHCFIRRDGAFIYYDDQHLTPYAARNIAELIDMAIDTVR